jgi:uncharacterized tellurite resistance protein B-like protein
MHILFLILAVAGGAAFWWWRIKMVGEAASEVHDMAGRAYGKYKRAKFRKKVEDSPLESVDDHVAAAVVMLYAMAKEDGPMTPAGEAAVLREVRDTMKIDDSEELLVFSKWVASHVTDAGNVALRYNKLWVANLSQPERLEFVAMVRRVGDASGVPAQRQKQITAKLSERLGLQG